MVRKAFCISNTLIHVYISPLIIVQKKHDEHENSINALRSHNVIIYRQQRYGKKLYFQIVWKKKLLLLFKL